MEREAHGKRDLIPQAERLGRVWGKDLCHMLERQEREIRTPKEVANWVPAELERKGALK